MSTLENIRWFKEQFGKSISTAVKDTPFTLDMLTAIACQETGYVWGRLRKKNLTIDRILELSVGDTISLRSSTFPRSKADLLAAPRGAEMYKIARDSLIDLGTYLPDFAREAAKPDKFCHGFGIFQYDIQFFKIDPDYFLKRRWAKLDQTVGKCISELKAKMGRAGVAGKTSLTDMEMAQVAIAYNRGRYDPALKLKQGHKDKDGIYYGEHFWEFLKLAKSVTVQPSAPAETVLSSNLFAVSTKGGDLMLRSAPRSDPGNIVTRLPNGQRVTVLSASPVSGFLEVEATIGGKTERGYAGALYLKPV